MTIRAIHTLSTAPNNSSLHFHSFISSINTHTHTVRTRTERRLFLSLSIERKEKELETNSNQISTLMEIGDGVRGGGDSWRRRPTESSHLRDFIQLKEGEDARRNSLTGLTLSDVLGQSHRPPPPPPLPPPVPVPVPVQSNRTLLDIIREEDPNSSYNKKNKTSWKAFTEKLRLSRTITATVHIPNPNRRSTSGNQPIGVPSVNNVPDLGRESLSDLLLRSSETNGELNSAQSNQQAVITLVNSSGENVQEVGVSLTALLEGENGEREPDVGISLMALLAETDREIGLEGQIAYNDEQEEGDEEVTVMEGEEIGGGEGGVDLMNKRCCICMVRHKGAAFIPCGHAFCRICSRELWVQRGSCPLCNGLILEILDIF